MAPSASPLKSDPKTEYIYRRPHLADYQLEALFCPEPYAYIEASSKSGKTKGAAVWLFEQAAKAKKGQVCCWLAPSLDQAKIGWRDMKNGLPPGLLKSWETAPPRHQLPNGVLIEFRTAEDADKMYGKAYIAAVVDEASRVKDGAWYALQTNLSTEAYAPVRVIGNVKGRKNWFYAACRRAEDQMSLPGSKRTDHFARISWKQAVEAGILNADRVLAAKERMPEMLFRELFEAEPGDDEGNPFGIEFIRANIMDNLSRKSPRHWGWDYGKYQNYTVGIALDEDGQVCRFDRFQLPMHETIARIRKQTGKVKALVDETGVGDPLVEDLQRRGGGNFRGFKFTGVSKQQIMEALAVAIQAGEIGYPDGPIVKELETFEYEYTRYGVHYQPMEGCHDDCVDALALANYGLPKRRKRILDDEDTGPSRKEIVFDLGGDDFPSLSDDDY